RRGRCRTRSERRPMPRCRSLSATAGVANWSDESSARAPTVGTVPFSAEARGSWRARAGALAPRLRGLTPSLTPLSSFLYEHRFDLHQRAPGKLRHADGGTRGIRLPEVLGHDLVEFCKMGEIGKE